jgi:hypothetical protein
MSYGSIDSEAMTKIIALKTTIQVSLLVMTQTD